MHIICLHSSQSSGAQWRALKQELAAQFSQAEILTPNLIGYGRDNYGPTHPPVADFRLADEIELLTPVMEPIQIDAQAVQQNRPQSVHLVGHSYGGALALRMARLMCAAGTPPASVSLYEPVAFHVLPDEDPARDEILNISQQMNALPLAEAAAAFVNYWNHDGYFEALPEKVQAGMIAKQLKVQADFSALIKEPAQLEDYAAISSPVLLLHGTESPLSSRRVVELLSGVLPQVTTAEVASGHMAPLTAANKVNPHFVDFLSAE